MFGQTLRGLVGQSMDGQRPTATPRTWAYPSLANAVATRTFTAPMGGWYRFVAWGSGGGNQAGGGGGGALIICERALGTGDRVTLQIGAGGAIGDTIITLPSGEVMVAGSGAYGASGAGGVPAVDARRGDIGVAGTAGVGSTGGDAASYGDYTGGKASVPNNPGAGSPGGGTSGTGTGASKGGDGLVIITQVRLRP